MCRWYPAALGQLMSDLKNPPHSSIQVAGATMGKTTLTLKVSFKSSQYIIAKELNFRKVMIVLIDS